MPHRYLVEAMTRSLTNLADTEMIAQYLSTISQDDDLRDEYASIYLQVQKLRKQTVAFQKKIQKQASLSLTHCAA